jgi:putative cardiolipin synthase
MIAHSAYKRWRKRLLRIGVELYESREDSPVIESYSAPPVMPGFLGLHSKALVVDDRWSFIGSPNIDPRSLVLNTEFGFFIESPELAARLRALLERDLTPDAAWRVQLDERGRLSWTSSAGTVTRQPALGTKQRFMEFFLNMLPFKDQV